MLVTLGCVLLIVAVTGDGVVVISLYGALGFGQLRLVGKALTIHRECTRLGRLLDSGHQQGNNDDDGNRADDDTSNGDPQRRLTKTMSSHSV